MGWREPEPKDVGKVVFNRNFKRTQANLIRAREILYATLMYLDAASKHGRTTLKKILKGDSKKIWHGEHIENFSGDE